MAQWYNDMVNRLIVARRKNCKDNNIDKPHAMKVSRRNESLQAKVDNSELRKVDYNK